MISHNDVVRPATLRRKGSAALACQATADSICRKAPAYEGLHPKKLMQQSLCDSPTSYGLVLNSAKWIDVRQPDLAALLAHEDLLGCFVEIALNSLLTIVCHSLHAVEVFDVI